VNVAFYILIKVVDEFMRIVPRQSVIIHELIRHYGSAEHYVVTHALMHKTLQEAIKYYSDEANCIRTVAEMRWPNGPFCPACGHMQHYWPDSQKRWKCKECWKQVSVKLGTIFEDSPISLEKWLVALWMLANCKNGVSSYEIARTIALLKNQLGLGSSVYALPCRTRPLAANSAHLTAPYRLMRLSSAAKLGTCTSLAAHA
jgi:transposase-like protein